MQRGTRAVTGGGLHFAGALQAESRVPQPLLNKLGQKIRLIIAGVLLVAGFVISSIAPLFFERGKDVLGLTLLGAGCIAMFAAIPLAVRATSCPKCRLRWMGYSMAHLRPNEWLPWLLTMHRCPKCGYTGEER